MTTGEQADVVAELRRRLEQHPAGRRPLQHATAQFHLGSVLLDRGVLDEAEDCFATAAALFAARGARAEQAKALNAMGATLRAAGRLELAAQALEHAAAGLAAAGLPLDEGAARFNLGLVLRERGDPAAATDALRRAGELLDHLRVPAQAAACARELGSTLLELGDVERAREALERAVALADRGADPAGRGAAANALGLALLAAGRAAEAAAAFRTAATAHPRDLRPDAFAMAQANLAWAHERAGERAPARLAARQALAIAQAPAPVRRQATGVIDRLGTDDADLGVALAARPPQDRAELVREELARSARSGGADAAADMAEWIGAVAESGGDPAEVAELWLAGLLELPPEDLERLVEAALRASAVADPQSGETFRAAVVRAMARFGVPQWMRLQGTFSQAAATLGDTDSWR